MFKKISELETHHQILFALVISFAVVLFWRGMWGIADLYLFPNMPLLSYGISIGAGLLILIATGYVTKELM